MAAILTTSDLNRHFGGVRAVVDVNLNIEEKRLQSIIGPNGAGKTTLFNVITGRLPATSGKVHYLGRNITNRPVHTLVRQGLCRTFQINSLFLGLSVFENVRIAAQARHGGSLRIFAARDSLPDVNAAAWRVLEQVGLTPLATLQTSTLSYGDQRLLEVAIALAGEPRVLLLDEPTAGMSQGESQRITQLIRSLLETTTVVLVEHDVDMVMAISDRIAVMHQGALIAEGTPAEIQVNPLVREAYIGEEDCDDTP